VTASPELRFDTGRLCLDLIATVGSRLSNAPVERLDSPDRLGQWLVGTGLVPPGQPLAIDAAWLERFHRLRALLHRIVHAFLRSEPTTSRDVDRLNQFARPAPPVPQARTLGHDYHKLHRVLADPVTVEELLAVVARDAIELLSGGTTAALLHECEGPTCDLVFVDTSRGHRRRWCASNICGNRERVIRHRQKSTAAVSSS
jgi:predicted RNA-binding Zn ribbon-like protein